MDANMHLIERVPPVYLQQGPNYCGGFQIKSILSSFGLDDGRDPKSYLGLWATLTGGTLPHEIKRILHKHGLIASVKRAHKLSDSDKIDALRNELNEDHPVILLVGSKLNADGSVRDKVTAHWISLWGYVADTFYAYDAFRDSEHYNDVPVGNVAISIEQLLNMWKGPMYVRLLRKDYLYIPIIN